LDEKKQKPEKNTPTNAALSSREWGTGNMLPSWVGCKNSVQTAILTARAGGERKRVMMARWEKNSKNQGMSLSQNCRKLIGGKSSKRGCGNSPWGPWKTDCRSKTQLNQTKYK